MSKREIIIDKHTLDISFLNDTDFVRRGLDMALKAHAGEFRKIRGEPFIAHPLGVVAITNTYDRSDRTQVRGLLHDVIDSPIARGRLTMGEVREAFDYDMVAEIASLSKSQKITDPALQREDYLTMTEIETSPDVQLTRAGDKIHNMRMAIEELQFVQQSLAFWSKFKGGKEVYVAWPSDVLVRIERSRALEGHPILEEYRQTIDEFQQTVARIEMNESSAVDKPA